jgi:hypothetical protein
LPTGQASSALATKAHEQIALGLSPRSLLVENRS